MGLPIVVGLWISKKLSVDLALFGVGAATFIASQLFHIPFNSWVLAPLIERFDLQIAPGSLDLAVFGLVFGFSAGFFEETARYLVYKRWIPKSRSWKEGLMFGAGHGGIEAVIFGALAFWGFLQLVALKDLSPEALSIVAGPEKVELIQSYLTAFWTAPWYYSLLGAVERLSTIAIHLSASLLVLQAFTRKNIGWYFIAVLWHTLVDALAVYGIRTWNVYITEGIILLLGIISLGIVFALRGQEPLPKEDYNLESDPVTSPPQLHTEPEEITMDKLEDSRYD